MRTFIMLTAIACLFGLTDLSHADQTIASQTIFGAHTQDRAQCIIRNIGTTSIPVTVTILGESGEIISTTSCGGSVTAGHNCSAFATISFGVAYACSATTSGSAKQLRGTLILFNSVDPGDVEPLRSAQLR
jgi:hypothetical protein